MRRLCLICQEKISIQYQAQRWKATTVVLSKSLQRWNGPLPCWPWFWGRVVCFYCFNSRGTFIISFWKTASMDFCSIVLHCQQRWRICNSTRCTLQWRYMQQNYTVYTYSFTVYPSILCTGTVPGNIGTVRTLWYLYKTVNSVNTGTRYRCTSRF